MRTKLQKGIAVVMTSTMIFACGQWTSASATKEPIPAWASAELNYWVEAGLLKGDGNGLLRPQQTINRAEFLAFVNRVFNYRAMSDKTFADVDASAWYAAEIAKAHAAGILQGDTRGNAQPLAALTREEAAVILSRVFDVASANSPSGTFTDDGAIASWASTAVYALKEAGYAQGAGGGAFLPKKGMSRAEAVKMISNIMGSLINDSSVHENVTGRNVVVNTAGGVLKGAKIAGDLYLAPGIGEGGFTLEDCIVEGTIYVLGGGTEGLVLKNSQAGAVKINSPQSEPKLILNGSSSVKKGIEALTGAAIVNETNAPIGSLNVRAGASGTISVTGDVTLLTVDSSATVNVGASAIETLIFTERAGGAQAKLDGQAQIGRVIADAGVTLTGSGDIGEAVINAEGVAFEKAPDKWSLNAKSATIAGKSVAESSVGSGSAGGGGTGGGGSGGGTVDMSTKIYSYDQVLGGFAETGTYGDVKQYVRFLGDPTYDPQTANAVVGSTLPNFTNARTFVNADYEVKPSIFASLRGVNTSVLDARRDNLWIGTDNGVTKINLATNAMTEYTAENKQLADNKTLLLISDGGTGVFAITEHGVSYIRK
ncbi:S-layer homology domain-containing protein [Cohnella cellulosilytica]|uniref:S-layer homology domain-containing protein n=1 Tax=Cohnella cellulosilytica TaxID=986710 RepID=A0ABW2FC09_9BACL